MYIQYSMNFYKLKDIYLKDKFLLYLFILLLIMPASLIAGNAVVNINLAVIVIFFLINAISKSEFNIFISKKFIPLFFFFILILITDLISLGHFNYKSIFLFKFYFFFLAINYVFEKEKLLLYSLSFFTFLTLIIFSVDILVQYNFGKDILGISSNSSHRYAGFMGDEWIAGSYISKLFLIGMVNFLFLKKLKIINLILMALFFGIVLITGDRIALFHYFLSLFLLCIFFQYKKIYSLKYYITLLFSAGLIFTIFFANLSESRKNAYTIDILIKLKLAKNFTKIYKFENLDQKQLDLEIDKNNTHIDLFISSFKLITDNTFFGTGTNNFYESCKNFKEKIYCENHSHNLYLNILSEQGIFVFLLFLYLLYKYVFQELYLIKKNNIKGIIFIIVLVILNPINISGDFFSTWTGTFFWYIFGIYSALSKNKF